MREVVENYGETARDHVAIFSLLLFLASIAPTQPIKSPSADRRHNLVLGGVGGVQLALVASARWCELVRTITKI